MERHENSLFRSHEGAINKTVRMEQHIKTFKHSNTQARAALGCRPSNRATWLLLVVVGLCLLWLLWFQALLTSALQ